MSAEPWTVFRARYAALRRHDPTGNHDAILQRMNAAYLTMMITDTLAAGPGLTPAQRRELIGLLKAPA